MSSSPATPPVTRFLTGVTTSGTPHLGNYVGAFRPAVQASKAAGTESFYFLADYHALIKTGEPARVRQSTLEIAACWLACGLDPAQVVFYRQSDIPEIPELTWFLTCVTGKGVLNRAHAYKAAVDKNTAAGADTDADVTAGLFMYPVLMAADILMFNAHKVPVGRDQVQHIEMARDIAASFNHRYGEHFVLPEAAVEETVALLPGLDGRKMSKSYDNHIPLFTPREQLKKLIAGIVTDSRAPGEPKATEGSALFQIYEAFASAEETAAFKAAFAAGISWADAKQALFERIDREVAPLRARYDALMANPAEVEAILLAGAKRARALSQPFITQLRYAVGLRSLSPKVHDSTGALVGQGSPLSGRAQVKAAKVALPTFKQYRESDGKFYFKFIDAGGRLLLQSPGFAAPKEAGAVIAQLQRDPSAAAQLAPADGVSPADVQAALRQLLEGAQ